MWLISVLTGAVLSTSLHAQQSGSTTYPAVNDACIKRSGLQPNGAMLECRASLVAHGQHENASNSIAVEIRSDGSRHLLHSVLNVSNLKGNFLLCSPRTPQPIVVIILPADARRTVVQDSLRTVLTDASDAGMTDIFIRQTNGHEPTIEIHVRWMPPDPDAITRPGDRGLLWLGGELNNGDAVSIVWQSRACVGAKLS